MTARSPVVNQENPPPHNPEAEQSVLGGLLLAVQRGETTALDEAIASLTEEIFYDKSHQLIFASARDLRAEGLQPDLITLTDRLRQRGQLDAAGGASYVTSLLDTAFSPAQLSQHSTILKRAWAKRAMGTLGGELWNASLNGHEADELIVLAERMLEGVKAVNSTTNIAASPLTAGELLQLEGKPVDWLVDGLLPRRGTTFVSAEAGRLKTWFVFDIGIAIATGRSAFGALPVLAPRPVLIIQEEMQPEATADRLRRLGLPKDAPLWMACGLGFRFDDPTWSVWLREFIRAHEIALVIADSFTRMHRQDENSAGAMNALFQDWLKPHVDGLGVAFFFTHHSKKPGPPGSSTAGRHLLRGSSDLLAIADSAIFLKAFGNGVLVTHEKSRHALEAKPFALHLEDREEGVALVYDGPTEEMADRLETAKLAVAALVTEEPGLGTDAIVKRLKAHHKDRTVRRALKDLEGAVLNSLKDGRFKRWYPVREITDEG
jgi:replicative DNA helicase